MKYFILFLAVLFTVNTQAQSTKKTANTTVATTTTKKAPSTGVASATTKPSPTASKTNTITRQSLSEFRKIRWGTKMDSVLINGIKPVFIRTTEFGKSESNAYSIDNDDLTIGTVSLQKILYVFTSDSALSRIVLIGDKKKFGEMKYIIAYKFNDPVIIDKADGYDCVWDLDDCQIRLSFSNDQNVFTTNFFSDYELNNSKRENRSVDDF
jgi:hypothetical protein